uniref:Ig-like domain-containing protein n=1 Tax=Sinocyclocheilus rhinocerous TaxID=307959 RepID=A0A673I644_9TELE
MSDECHLCLLGLIVLSSLLTGSSGVDETHVFISSGENVRLSCNNALPDCKSTTWNYNRLRDSAAVELINLGKKKKDTESHERLSLGSDCSLNINNISTEDYGYYTCQQWTDVKGEHQKQAPDARVYLHVLHVSSSSSSSSQTEISAGHHNREWRCEVTQRDQVKTSVTYTVKSSVIVTIVEFAAFAAPTVIFLQIICARRAGRKDSQHPEEIALNTISE